MEENSEKRAFYYILQFPNNLSEEIKKKGYSQNQFAKILDVSQQNVNRWCTGKAYPNYIFLLRICYELDISPNELLDWESYKINFDYHLYPERFKPIDE